MADDVFDLLTRINALSERVAALERQDQPIGTISALALKSAPVPGDQLFLLDSAASNAVKLTTLTQLLTSPAVDQAYTPTLKFGGGNTGMTGTFVGRYQKVGRLALVSAVIVLTNKGSSTGNATISLPVQANVDLTGWANAYWYLGSAFANVSLYIPAYSSEGGLFGVSSAATAPSQITNSAFANDSQIRFSITYLTA